MRRFVGLLALLFCAVPLGISVAGCGKGTAVTYCNGSGYGPQTGQVKTITLASNLTATGESLNYGQIGTQLSATAADCVGAAVSEARYTYATTDMTIADVNPTNGSVCGGSWNRNTGGGILDYTVCTPPAASNTNHTASITAAAAGATSNAIQVFVHPVVTGIVLQSALSTSCSTDPGSDCCSISTNGTTVTALPYDNSRCVSQGTSRQLLAKVYAGDGTPIPANNITCQVGHIAYGLQGATSTATIDANGVATANQPGSSLITATVANSSSAVNAGFFSTCPPASIVLSAVNNPGANAVTVALNNPQAFTATVTDVNGIVLTGTALEFNSTLPINFPTGSGTVTPAFPGSATITAACIPPTCNTSPFSQIGYLGNGKPVTSNGIVVTAPGTASDVLYMGSTGSQYIATLDFTTGQLGSPIKLNFAPNSMVISQDGSTIYLGSSGGLEILNTASGAVAGTYQTVQGSVLAVAPNNSYAVVTDSTRQTVSLVTNTGAVFSTFNGTGTRAQWTPDSTTLYVTTSTGQLLTYSTFVGWESALPDETYADVAVTVPSYGAYFAGAITEGRSYCSNTTLSSTGTPPTATNLFTACRRRAHLRRHGSPCGHNGRCARARCHGTNYTGHAAGHCRHRAYAGHSQRNRNRRGLPRPNESGRGELLYRLSQGSFAQHGHHRDFDHRCLAGKQLSRRRHYLHRHGRAASALRPGLGHLQQRNPYERRHRTRSRRLQHRQSLLLRRYRR